MYGREQNPEILYNTDYLFFDNASSAFDIFINDVTEKSIVTYY